MSDQKFCYSCGNKIRSGDRTETISTSNGRSIVHQRCSSMHNAEHRGAISGRY